MGRLNEQETGKSEKTKVHGDVFLVAGAARLRRPTKEKPPLGTAALRGGAATEKQATSQRQATRLVWRVWPLLRRRCRALASGHKGPQSRAVRTPEKYSAQS